MKAASHVLLPLTVMLVAAGFVRADETKTTNYILFPITTDLQRVLSFSPHANAYAQFDVALAAQGKKFDLNRVDVEGFRADLARLVQKLDVDKPGLQIFFRYANVELDPKEQQAMETAISAICRQAGFDKVQTGGTYEGGTWKDKMVRVTSDPSGDDAAESPVENEFVRAYPVRTPLSHFLLGSNDYDCVIELRQPIDGRFSEVSPTVRQVIGEQVARLDLPRKRKVNFRCLTTTAGSKSVERYFGGGGPAPVSVLLEELGFRDRSYSSMTMSVSVEDLLGKPVPDFTLDALAGGEIHFHELIRGKVALIAFWGVACGACRVEAPYLTALSDQFKNQGLAVVAVNGYDESREDFDKYARDKHLTHPIALMGKKVAEEKFTVASYPITFLIDRQGKIVDYHLGFEPGDEKAFATSIERLLAEHAGGEN
jgi:thiol-disulfide isomerase/thioredoxin